MHYASAEAVKPLLTDGGEIAFLDVREAGQYGKGHPFFAVNLPIAGSRPLPRRCCHATPCAACCSTMGMTAWRKRRRRGWPQLVTPT